MDSMIVTSPGLAAALLAAGLLTVIATAQAQEGKAQPQPTLQVSGSGEVRAEPDLAVVRLGVMVQRSSAREAQQEASRIAGAILEGIGELGVPGEAIQTSQLTLSAVVAGRDPRGGEGEPRIVGYRASNVVSVRLEELAKLGSVVDAGLEAGANQIDGIDFELDDDLTAREEALASAVAEARGKARAIADALGVELGEVLTVVEGGVSIATPHFAVGRAMMAEAASTPVAAGQVTVSAQVDITYRLAGRR